MNSMNNMRIFLALAAVLFLGFGCSKTPAFLLPPDLGCPEVCTAICEGLPEPEIPSNCPTPMCACEKEGEDVSELEPTDEERACLQDEDCVYADNSICPFTNAENVIAINKNASKSFRARRPDVPKDTLCIELFAEPEGKPQCVRGLCTVPGR
ncbi:MAG: hypothetical protein UY82_C0017G0006 [Candidatus Uhrbacteria bacterium GW2011_GWC2_53_7]|uniref:Uncharacterized protein n=1 Tax=Candidatus Uhrbacteria bacterium GW2011_GWC2_53_7 TaxID=1618986 RepID=A0A0G1Y0I3_9BACT|nr:MAG: hypothetical protein UY82_C0017G0006 [Candidatus Uhrbacteria bacterium GW2011_GWC2_53_7]